MTRNKIRVLKLMGRDPHCHWCGVEVFILDPVPPTLPDNYATIDHLYSRSSKGKRLIAMEYGKLLRDGSGVYYVLSCSKCNTEKGGMKPSTFKKKRVENKVRVAIHQPAYYPYLGVISKIMHSDIHVCLDHVQYSKGSFDNRNRILKDNKHHWLTVPVKTSGKFKNNPLNSVEVVGNKWQAKHIHEISKAYNVDGSHKLLSFLYNQDPTLIHYAEESTERILSELGHKYDPLYSSAMDLKKTGTDLILEICKQVGATEYLSGPMGMDYLDLEAFEEAGIKTLFHEWSPRLMLSALHYLLSTGKTDTYKLIDQYAIITQHV